MKPTYVIMGNGQAIKCLDCGLISFHPDDVQYRYCGHCHEFHEFKDIRARIREHFDTTPAAEVMANAEKIRRGRVRIPWWYFTMPIAASICAAPIVWVIMKLIKKSQQHD
jgi:hypothetical protein